MSAWLNEALRYPVRHRGALAWIVLLSFVSIGLNLLLPWPIKLIVDDVLGGKPLPESWSFLSAMLEGADPSRQLLLLALASAGLFVLLRIVEMARLALAARVGRRMQYELGSILFLHLQSLSPRFHARAQTGDLVRRVVTDSKCVDEFFVGICIPALTAAVMLVAMLVPFSVLIWQHALSIQAVKGLPFCAVKFDCGCGSGEVLVCRKLAQNAVFTVLAIGLTLWRRHRLCLRSELIPIISADTASFESVNVDPVSPTAAQHRPPTL